MIKFHIILHKMMNFMKIFRYFMENLAIKYIKKHHFFMKKCLFLMSKFHKFRAKIMNFRLFSALFDQIWAILSQKWWKSSIFSDNLAISWPNRPGIYPRKIIKKFRKMIKNIIFCIFLWIISMYFMKYFKNNFINMFKFDGLILKPYVWAACCELFERSEF